MRKRKNGYVCVLICVLVRRHGERNEDTETEKRKKKGEKEKHQKTRQTGKKARLIRDAVNRQDGTIR